ncbi:protein of unknown function [Magnetospirillum sp. XM-1]|nr:protein of unknown function [Magnetospirillum sp. XM-1]
MSGPFVHLCCHPGCRDWGSFGEGVSLRQGREGKWWCRAHLPESYGKHQHPAAARPLSGDPAATSAPPPPPKPKKPTQGTLL